MMRTLSLLLMFFGSAFGQLVSVGVKGGVLVTNPAYYSDESRRYTVGPSIEFRLPFRFAAEFDALYSRTGQTAQFNIIDPLNGVALTSIRQRGNSWEFPLLGKYYFTRRSRIEPFVGTGYTFTTTWVHMDTRYTNGSVSADYRSPFDVGAVVAAGARVKAGRLAVIPEFRYTHFGANASQVKKNQVKFLLGVSF